MTELEPQAPMTQLSDAMAAPWSRSTAPVKAYLDDVDTIKDELRQLLATAP